MLLTFSNLSLDTDIGLACCSNFNAGDNNEDALHADNVRRKHDRKRPVHMIAYVAGMNLETNC